MNLAFEIIGTILSLAFLYFLIREKKICWLFGILGSLLSIYLFYSTKLYSECILRLYYVFIGFYGYYLWQQRDHHDKGAPKIIKWKPSIHVIIVLVGLVLVFLLGYVFDNYSDAKKSYFDAFTTVFSVFANLGVLDYFEWSQYLSICRSRVVCLCSLGGYLFWSFFLWVFFMETEIQQVKYSS